MNAFTQYLKDTRAELHHVAWPTRTQTLVYTGLVASISLAVSLYLGFFDFLFTSSLSNMIQHLPAAQQNPITITQESATGTPATTTPAFKL